MPAPVDVGVLLTYLALGVFVVNPLWTDRSGGYLVSSVADQTLFECYLSFAAHAVVSGDSPFHKGPVAGREARCRTEPPR